MDTQRDTAATTATGAIDLPQKKSVKPTFAVHYNHAGPNAQCSRCGSLYPPGHRCPRCG